MLYRPVTDHSLTVGFLVRRAEFCQHFVLADARRASKVQLLVYLRPNVPHNLRRDQNRNIVPIRIILFRLFLIQIHQSIRRPIQSRCRRPHKRLRRIIIRRRALELRVPLEHDPMNLRREIQENLVDTRLLHLLHIRRQELLDGRQNLPTLQPVRIQTDFPRSDLPESLIPVAVAPGYISLFPRRDVLADQLRALLFRFGHRDMAVQAEGSCGIVDGYQALPLLDGERFRRVEA